MSNQKNKFSNFFHSLRESLSIHKGERKNRSTRKILGIFEKKRKQIEQEQQSFPEKLIRIQEDIYNRKKREESVLIKKQRQIHTSYEKRLKIARKNEQKRIIALKRHEIALRQRAEFVRQGGAKVALKTFRGLDKSLQKNFAWYEKWHFNPIAPKVHTASLAIYLVAIAFLVSNFVEIPARTSAIAQRQFKSTTVTTTDSGDSESKTKSIQASDKEDKSIIDLKAAQVDFSSAGEEAKTKIEAKTTSAQEQSISFTVLQPTDLVNQSVSMLNKEKSLTHKFLSLFSKARAQEDSAIPSQTETPSEQLDSAPTTTTSPTAISTATVVSTSTPDVSDSKVSDLPEIQAKTEEVIKDKDKTTIKVNQYLDLVYSTTDTENESKIKETAVIKDASVLTQNPDYHLSFSLDLKGLTAEEGDNNSFNLRDENGKTVMKIASPVIEDAKKQKGSVSLELDTEKNLATYKIDPTFVDSATFPLYLDPTVTIATSTITNLNSFSKDRTLFEATNGDMISIYSAGAEVDYKISSDKGNTWSAATKIIDSSVADDNGFSGWITADNKIHFTYSDNNTNPYIFYRQMTYDTATHAFTSMGTEYTVESAGTSQAFPTVTQKSDATIFVAYRYYDATDYTIRVKASTDSGVNWSASTTLSAATNASSATYPAITLWNDNPAVIYNFANTSLRWNYYTGSAWQAAGWANESISIEVGSTLNQEFSISQQTSDDYLHLAWKDDSAGIRYKKLASHSDPTQWDAASTQIASGASHANDKNPSIGLGLNDTIYLYYSEYVGANSYNIKYAEKIGSGGLFGTPIAVTTDNANNLIAQAALKPAMPGGVTSASSYDLSLNGTSAYTSVASGFADFTGGITMSIWAYPTSVKNYARFFDFSESGQANDNIIFNRAASTNDLAYSTFNGATGSTAVTASGAIALNTWQHFVVTQNASGVVTIYKNGAVVAGPTTIGLPTNVTRTTNYIGESNWAADAFYAGQLDEPQIYNRALSVNEVATLYNSGAVSQGYIANGLIAGWHFEENTGTTSADYSGYSKTLTFQGSPTPTWVSQISGGAGFVGSSIYGTNPYAPVVFAEGTGSPYNLKYAPTVKVWSAAADGNWETAGNWTPSGAPAAGDIVVFDATSIKNCTVTTFTSGNGIVDNLGGMYVNTGYSGTVTFQKKPSQNADPFKVNILGDFVVNAGTVVSQGDITVAHGGVTDGQGNQFVADNIMIGISGTINTNGLGFASGTGPGRAASDKGAGYGGEGIQETYSASYSQSYGDYADPISLGSGGYGGAGGGSVVLSAVNTVNIVGSLSSNGGACTGNYRSGGSGGSIKINAETISGNGTTTADAGAGTCFAAFGSAGGRVALNADTISYTGTLSAYSSAGLDNVNKYAPPGTIFKRLTSQDHGDLIINGGSIVRPTTNQLAAHLESTADTGSYEFDSIAYSNYGLLSIDTSQTLSVASGTFTGSKTAGLVNGGTLTVPNDWTLGYMYSSKNGTISGWTSKNMVISSTGLFTNYPNTNLETYKVNLSLDSLDIQGEINVSGVGFSAGNGTGYTNSTVGSAYGGEGGNYGAATKAYGDYSNPISLGSGGSSSSGGGAVIIDVSSGAVHIDGTISADGPSTYNSGGSGGSVNISAGTISGAGTVSADGGPSTYYTTCGGGGGGRIRLNASTSITLPDASVSAKGGKLGSNTNTSGGAGTIFKKVAGQSNGDLIVNNGDNTPNFVISPATHLKTSADNGTYVFDNISFSNYGLLNIDASQTLDITSTTVTGSKTAGIVNAGTLTTASPWTLGYLYMHKNGTITALASKDITITATGMMTTPANSTLETYLLNLQFHNLIIQSSGEINVDYKGFSANNGDGKGISVGCCSGAGGGAYGGNGSAGGGAAGGTAYGSVTNPVNLGSGGGSTSTDAPPGGGAAILNLNSLDISGTISAKGQNSGDYGGAGAGGSINITATTITGSSATIAAYGGTSGWRGGGGGGGRIAINYTDDQYTGGISTLSASARGGYNGIGWSDNTALHGAAGTVYIKKTTDTNGSLKIDNSIATTTIAVTPLTTPLAFKSVTVSNYGKTNIATNADPVQNTFAIDNDLTIDATSQMDLLADRDGTPASGAWPILTVGGNAAISGILTSTGNGYIHDAGAGKGIIGSSQGSGAGYGGAGGNSANGTLGGPAYGTQSDNNYIGSGGGNTLGGAGGGMIKMSIVGNLALSTTGIITTNGSAGGAAGGGGSGGAIQISVSGTLTGSGAATITANGGAGGSNGGGGGGGRIALYTAGDTFTGTKTATGGAAGTGGATAGSNGSVFAQHSPASLTMNAPNDAAPSQIQKTVFRFNSTDQDGDWIQYKIQIATDSGFTQSVSTFDETLSQNPTDGGRTALFSNQDKTTGGGAGADGYSSGREGILTMQTNLTPGATYYWRFYAYDPEGVDSFDGTKHWSVVSGTRSFTIATIDHISFSTAQQEIVVTFCSAIATVSLRDASDNNMYLTDNEGAKVINLTTTSASGNFYSDGSCQNAISGNNLNLAVGDNSASFYYKDTTPSAVGGYWNITATETPSAGWTDAAQQIRVRPGDFGSFEIAVGNNLSTITAGVPFSTPANDVTITAKDVFGNVKSDWAGQIWFYSSDSQADFTVDDTNKYQFTSGEDLDNGSHTFTGTGFTFKTKGSQTLALHNSDDAQYDTSIPIQVNPAAIQKFTLSSYPKTSTGHYAISAINWNDVRSPTYNPAVTALDEFDNIKDDFTGAVWFDVKDGLGQTADYYIDNDTTNRYTFTTGADQDNGIHTFPGSGFTVNTAGTNLKLIVQTADNGGKTTEFTITIKPQAIDHFVVTSSPTISRDGTNWEKGVDTALTEDITVTAYDAFNNPKTDYAYDAASGYGMAYFYSSDTNAVLPYTKSSSADIANCFHFPDDDTGSYTFTTANTPDDYFKFQTGGPQTLTASECIDPTSTYATSTDSDKNKYDPRFDGVNPLKNAADTGQLPLASADPNVVAVAPHVPGSTHTASSHSDDTNNLIEAAPGHQQATLSWKNPFDLPGDEALDAQVYIYRCSADCANPANYSKIVTDPVKVTGTASEWSEYTDTSLTNGTEYSYQLTYAYLKQDDTYIESDKSIVVTATPADIAPREVTADQLDLTENVANAGKVKIDYKLRWDSTISLAYYNPTTASWVNATSGAQSGDVGAGMTGSEGLTSHVAYFDPRIDFSGQYLTGTFKVRVRAIVNSANAYADSSVMNLDSKTPAGTSLIIDASAATTTLNLTATDNSEPITMMLSNDAAYAGATWQAFATSVPNWDLGNTQTVYAKIRDNYNNIVELEKDLLPIPQNVQIKDASNTTTSEYRLTVIWTAVEADNFKQYRIWRATDGQTFSPLGTANQNGYLDMNLVSSTTYSYKVATEDTFGNLSRVSEVASSSPGTSPDVTAPPTVELFGWKQDLGVRAKITWTTDQLSDSSVALSKGVLSAGSNMTAANNELVKIAGNPEMVYEHEIWLYNLDPQTKYYFKAISKNGIQIAGYSDVMTFDTPVKIELLVSGMTITDVTMDSALVDWDTTKQATTLLEYGTSESYGTNVTDENYNVDHTFKLTGLAGGTKYYLRAKATDSDGNTTYSDRYYFQTPEIPVVSDVVVKEVSYNTAIIEWKTNVNTDSNIEFGINDLGGMQGKADSTTIHSVTLIGLESNTTYSFHARSKDQFGNVALGQNMSFTTSVDTAAPKITEVKSEVIASGSGDTVKYKAIISWATDETSTSKVEFSAGVSGDYTESTPGDVALNSTHVMILPELRPNSSYHFRVVSKDKAGNQANSEDVSLITPPKEKSLVKIILDSLAEIFAWVPKVQDKFKK